MSKLRYALGMAVILLGLLAQPVGAAQAPDVIPLPVGFQPEGIAVGQGSTFYTGSLADGRVLHGDLLTGKTSVLVAGQTGMASTGMMYDQHTHNLFVSGAGTGLARVFDAESGALKQTYTLAGRDGFINDVVLTADAAYFTNSNAPTLYRVPLGMDGALPDPSQVQSLTLSGDWSQVTGFNANGIEASDDGKWLVVVNSTAGKLYRVDPQSGAAKAIDLGGESVTNGDGLRFHHGLLYVVRNMLNQIVVVSLSSDLTSGKVVDRLTNPNFQVPTTLAAFGDSLYTVNAKFGVADPTTTPYEVVRVPLK